tara:strand:+ start:154 stop:606 length:453 start_codon:yes stop_codon:yes gene_type:complete
MKKTFFILITVFFSGLIFSQENKALESQIVKQWMDYSKGFEYKDYERIASHFAYPAIFNNSIPTIVRDKNMMIKAYKSVRENVQKDYKYSLIDKWKLINITNDFLILDAHYSRYNADYKQILSGRGLYFYRKLNDKWFLKEVTTLSQNKL